MIDILLIHGAWHGGWCWARVAAALRAQGWRVACPDLPGAPGTTLARATRALPPARIVLGHSMGGIPAEALAARHPPAALIHLCSYLPRPGDSLATLERLLPAPPRRWPRDADGRLILPPDAARAMMLHDAPPATARHALRRLRPQPQGVMRDPCPGPAAAVPRHYVLCEADRAIAPALQQAMAARVPGVTLHPRPWDHAPFLTQPRALAGLIDIIARDHAAPLATGRRMR